MRANPASTPRTLTALAFLAHLWALLAAGARRAMHAVGGDAARRRSVEHREGGFMNLAGIFGIVGTILTVVVTLLVVANLFDTYADGVADVNENLTSANTTFGDETTDGIKPVFAIVVGLVALIGIVGLIIAPFNRL